MKTSIAGARGQPRVTLPPKSTGALRKAITVKQPAEIWNLRLYVAGLTPGALLALTNLKALCKEHLAGRYRIEVVDLLKHPKLARGEQILALPTLVRRLPRPLRQVVGDLSDTQRVLVGLNLERSASRS
jgi:circadian clock protein KaiB